MFDNFGSMRVGQSRALEVDPFTQQIAWRYGEAEGQGFYSDVRRLHPAPPQRQHAHHVESNEGRAIEVTPDKAVVWEYRNPFRAGEKNELIATLEQVERLPADLERRLGPSRPGPLSVRLGT